MKKIFIISLLLISYQAQALTLNIAADKPSEQAIPLTPALKATLSYNNGKFNLNLPGQATQAITSVVPAETFNNNTQVIVEDFNFDGVNDLAIAKSAGYMGVNIFYDLYLLEQNKIVPSITDMANPEIRKDFREIRSGSKSGNTYDTMIYRILNNKPYLFINTTTVVGSGLLKIFIHDTSGNVTKQYVASSYEEISEKLKPIELKIKSPKAYFYNEPAPEHKTGSYVIAGDSVTLYDISGEYVLAEYSGKSITKKWLRYQDLSIGEE
ncbi:hypothetical protein K1X76_00010 [bacterium]|nr:hypothetical protein [bacterium]